MSEAKSPAQFEMATLGGGCFWCLEAVYAELRGVVKIESGYAGGAVPNPTYRQVCSGTTGHAEVVQITFDPAVIAFSNLLNIFFTIHDPTTLNRQGGDVGTQYRSVIFHHNEAQRQEAQSIIRELEEKKIWKNPIVTAVEPLHTLYRAEDYHQEYYSRNPEQRYCQAVIAPKVAKLRKMYMDKLKKG